MKEAGPRSKKTRSRLLFRFCGIYYISLSFFASSGEMAERSKAAVSKTVNGIFPFGGSNPPLSAIFSLGPADHAGKKDTFSSPPLVPERSRALPQWNPRLPGCFSFSRHFPHFLAFFRSCLQREGLPDHEHTEPEPRPFSLFRRHLSRSRIVRCGVSTAAGRTAAGSRQPWRA